MIVREVRRAWVTPRLVVHGTVAEITGDVIVKNPGMTDTIVIGGVTMPAPGSQVVATSP